MNRAADLKNKIRSFPDLPGVYLMKDSAGEVIYVGKAKRLKPRVSSYFSGGDGRARIEFLLEKINDIEIIITEDERQALVLELDLIKQYKPHYNIRLKDDRAPLMLRLDRNSKWPRFELTRKKLHDGAQYFGPYPFSYELTTLLDAIERTIPLRTCTDRVLLNRVRPCMQHQIKRCAAPCCLEVSESDYDKWIDEAVSILEGNTDEIVLSMEERMIKAADQLRFEEAAEYRDKIKTLKQIQLDKTQMYYGEDDIDAIALYREGRSVEVSIIRTINGRLSGSVTYGFTDVLIPDDEIVSSVISQYYRAGTRVPSRILLGTLTEDLEWYEEILSDTSGHRVEILSPQRGLKARLMDLARANVKENFEARFSQEKKSERVLSALKDILGLDQIPRLIECIDISHIQGSSTVGAVVCFRDGSPERSRYRHFHLSQEGKPDDFASMYETVERHLSRGREEGTLCDLLVIDGGPPQIVQALKVRDSLSLTYPTIIALAKKRDQKGRKVSRVDIPKSSGRVYKIASKPERIYIERLTEPLVLSPDNEVLQLLERIRDETHRVAISFHRDTRSKKQFQGPLDKIPGLGPKRKRALIKTFGSIKNIREATEEDLIVRGELPRPLARRIYQFFQD
ncbi:MAG TPA: excinuclease ABC subunit UvrC [Oligoflexia bacterium]|nr:excinuclease ABC subunit UvrC [Oligoflexia bacterium]HMP49311.1 excinuclease ABC subunit UvrC [Oligoflexia bacterium]